MKLALSVGLMLSLVSGLASARSMQKATATCSDKYQKGIKLTLDDGKVTINWPADHEADIAATTINYTLMSDADAADYGFTLSDSDKAYLSPGDDDVPNQYVILPALLGADASLTKFDATYGSNAPDEGFDSSFLISMSCNVK